MAEISDERYEELRLILERQSGRSYTFEEAREIGRWAGRFFQSFIELNYEGEQKTEN